MDESRLQERLLARGTFGPRPGDRERIRFLGTEAWLAQELSAGPHGDSALETRLARFPALAYGAADWIDAEALPDPAGMDDRRRQDALVKLHGQAIRIGLQLASARVVRAVHASSGLREVMVDFWSNHFSVDARKGIVGGLLPYHQREVLDRHALGRFEDLLVAVARSPAMLFYLDNWSSTAAADAGGRRVGLFGGRGRQRGINENYARELLELHTLGVDGGYTQEDVISAARALTGWSLESRRQTNYRYHPALHDTGPKTVLGEALHGTGEAEGEALLRRLAQHPATARHVSRKLAERFVGDDPPAPLVARCASEFLASGGDIPSVLRVILLSPELADPGSRKLKTPLRLFASALRAGGGETDGSEATLLALGRLGELPFFARTPAGFPEASGRWINPGAILERWKLAFSLADGDEAIALAAPEFQWC
jgi:uncharacterized protein (DUF1800 family)